MLWVLAWFAFAIFIALYLFVAFRLMWDRHDSLSQAVEAVLGVVGAGMFLFLVFVWHPFPGPWLRSTGFPGSDGWLLGASVASLALGLVGSIAADYRYRRWKSQNRAKGHGKGSPD